MKKNKKDEPLWCKIYRDEVIKPKIKQRQTEQRGRTEASRAGFYSTNAWIMIRDKRRRNNPLCQRCEQRGFLRPGKIVNHIKPVEDYPELALNYDNTEHLCDSCNDWQTKQDARERKQRQKLARGKRLIQKFEQTNETPRGEG